MRIASSSSLPKRTPTVAKAALLIALGILPFTSAGTQAGDIALPQIGSPTAPVVAPVPLAVPASPSASIPALAPQIVSTPADTPRTQNGGIEKNIAAMEDRVSENAKGVVRHLDTVSETTTFADLNNARQTVTRIEAMIDVEKRLAELDKLRNERGKLRQAETPAPSFVNAIPASALAPLPRSVPPVEMHVSEPTIERHPVSVAHPEITRIYGASGKYTAVLKYPSGEVKTVRVGDKVADGTVRVISASSVGVDEKGRPYTLHVKNVDNVYSSMY